MEGSSTLSTSKVQGIEKFVADAVANFAGDFNTLLFVPALLILSCCCSAEILSARPLFRRILERWNCVSQQKPRRRLHHSSSVELMTPQKTWICSWKTLKGIFSLKLHANASGAELAKKYEHVGLVSALLLGIASSKLTLINEERYAQWDLHVYGILWCSATSK